MLKPVHSKIAALLLSVSLTGISAFAQITATVAGNGISGFSGDGGMATLAKVKDPWGVATDASGNIYIADLSNNRIRKVDNAGIITTIGGTGTGAYSGDGFAATNANMQHPVGIATDVSGNVYFSDNANYRIRKISTAGIITTVAGSGSFGYSGDGAAATLARISDVNGIAVDTAGNIFLADTHNNCIRKVNTSGMIFTVAGDGSMGFGGDGAAATAAQLNYANDVTVDLAGNIYISDYYNFRIRKVDLSGIITTFAGDGSSGFTGDGFAATAASIKSPGGMVVDKAGNLIFGDPDNHRIRMVDPSGIISTIAGTGTVGSTGDGGAPLLATFNRPNKVAIDNCGNIYVSDGSDQYIRGIMTINTTPTFTGGPVQNISVCKNDSVSVNSILSIMDANVGQDEIWTVMATPLHGTVNGAYSASSTGSTVTPTGRYYKPITGYTGPDTFKIVVNDCGNLSDTTIVAVSVNPLPDPGSIVGIDSVCPGRTIILSDAVAGGVWNSSNTAIATVNSVTGKVTGIAPGYDTVNYVVTASGCSAVVSKTIKVRSLVSCATGIAAINGSTDYISLFPNPSDGRISVNFGSEFDEPATLVVTNTLGQRILTRAIQTNKMFDLELNVANGLYFVTVTTERGRWDSKFVITR